MTLAKVLYKQPQFRNRTFFQFKQAEIIIYNSEQSFSISVPSEYYQEITQLLKLLQIGSF